MTQEQKDLLTKDGKFYNTAKATLLLISEYFSSYGHKRWAWYKSKTGKYFATYQHVNVPYNKTAFRDLTVNVKIEKEEIIREYSFKEIRGLFEISKANKMIGIDSGVNSYCILRKQSTPKSYLKIVNEPEEFTQVVEV